MKQIQKLGGLIVLAIVLLLGVAAALFIKASRPAQSQDKQPESKDGQTARPDGAHRTGGDKPRVDRKEVEKGQPLPRNYLE